MYVLGSNSSADAIAEFAERVGRRVVRLPDDADPLGALRARPPGPRDAVIVADHDAPYAYPALAVALRGEAGFVGMPRARRLVGEVHGWLRAEGIPEEGIRRLHSPCGLDLGGRSVAEMALSIVAEIVAEQYGRGGGSLSATERAD